MIEKTSFVACQKLEWISQPSLMLAEPQRSVLSRMRLISVRMSNWVGCNRGALDSDDDGFIVIVYCDKASSIGFSDTGVD